MGSDGNEDEEEDLEDDEDSEFSSFEDFDSHQEWLCPADYYLIKWLAIYKKNATLAIWWRGFDAPVC